MWLFHTNLVACNQMLSKTRNTPEKHTHKDVCWMQLCGAGQEGPSCLLLRLAWAARDSGAPQEPSPPRQVAHCTNPSSRETPRRGQLFKDQQRRLVQEKYGYYIFHRSLPISTTSNFNLATEDEKVLGDFALVFSELFAGTALHSSQLARQAARLPVPCLFV